MEEKHVVVWDPSGEYWDGALVDPGTAEVLRTRKVATLPVEPGYIAMSAVGGWFKRSWGSGWPLGTTGPKMTCPLTLFVPSMDPSPAARSPKILNFCARLVPSDAQVLAAVREAGRLDVSGTIRLAPDSSQPWTHTGGIGARQDTVTELGQLGALDDYDGWTVYGKATITSPKDGFLGLGLYGSGPGLAIAWAAVSQSR